MKLLMQKSTLRNRILFITFSIFFVSTAGAQTLFTYGKHKVSKKEFLDAYTKNNTDSNGQKISYSDYLDLYIKFKLKVQDAIDSRMDTAAGQEEELKSFRYQLSGTYMQEDASIEILVNEAIQRIKKDIKIEVDGREIGWITAFVLPYSIENVAYSTATGKTTKYTGETGEHTLKVLAERPAVGQAQIAQILFAFKPGATETDKLKLSVLADSVYNALLKGASFEEMVTKYSDDNLTYTTKGEMPAFGVGKYTAEFENTAFGLTKDGDISRPFKTEFGYHIIKRLGRIEAAENKEEIKQRVLTSDRMQVADAVFAKNVREKIKKDASANDLATDSAVLEYYRNNLEKYNTEFASQINEFKQGNLLFAMMQKKVWDAASNDSVGLMNYYNQNKDKYNWENSADALVVTVLSTLPLAAVYDSVKVVAPLGDSRQREIGSSWRKLVEEGNGSIIIDSGRIELSQIPVIDRTNFTDGLITAPVTNEQDSSKTFAYIIKLYPQKETKSFEDARGSVINDYQQILEENWIAQLKKKYPVKINKKVLNNL